MLDLRERLAEEQLRDLPPILISSCIACRATVRSAIALNASGACYGTGRPTIGSSARWPSCAPLYSPACVTSLPCATKCYRCSIVHASKKLQTSPLHE